jgi:hypothetical protein
MVRTGAPETDLGAAQAALIKYKVDDWQRSTGFIYFLTAAHPDYPIKIGFTQKLASFRISAIQTCCPYALYFLARVPGTMQRERALHETFDHLRLRGEWFSRSPELLAYIESIK